MALLLVGHVLCNLLNVMVNDDPILVHGLFILFQLQQIFLKKVHLLGELSHVKRLTITTEWTNTQVEMTTGQ